jgi:tetratricopeptide (TPR) repeat protein
VNERLATILFADIVGCAEVSNHYALSSYAKFLKQFHETARVAKERVLSSYSDPEDMEWSVRGDEVCLILHKGTTLTDYIEDINRAILYAILLKLEWLLSWHNEERIGRALLPTNLGIGIHHGLVWIDKYPGTTSGAAGKKSSEGYAINFAKRVEGYSREGKFSRIFLSQDARYLADSAIDFAEAKQFKLKGISPDPYLTEIKDIDIESILKRMDFELPNGWLKDTTLERYTEVAQIHSWTEFWLSRLLHLYAKGSNDERSLGMLANLWYNRGSALGLVGNHEEAIHNYEMAVELKPDWESFFGMAISYGQLGRWEKALEHCEKAEKAGNFPESKKDLVDEKIRAYKCEMKKQ